MRDCMKDGRFPAKAAFVVAAVWAAWFLFSVGIALSRSADKTMARFGQFGDAFGSINALFTGLALVGLVYTIYQQEADSRENRQALAREKREQFLTARLNATAALLQAADVRGSLASACQLGGIPDAEKAVLDANFLAILAAHDSVSLSRELSILLQEARIGFDRDWDLALERAAIKRHVVSELTKMKMILSSYSEQDYKGDSTASAYRRRMYYGLKGLADQVREKGHRFASIQIESLAKHIDTREPMNFDSFQRWVTTSLTHLIATPDETWGD